MIGWLTGGAGGAARTVAMGDVAVAKATERLQCVGLGSCLAILAYDPAGDGGRGLAAVAHAILPRPFSPDTHSAPAKYSSDAVRNLGAALVERGAEIENVRIALVGGAQLLGGEGAATQGLPQLGERNIEEARLNVRAFGFALMGEDVGGTVGRNVILDAATGEVIVRTTLGGARRLCCLRDEPEHELHAPFFAGGVACAA